MKRVFSIACVLFLCICALIATDRQAYAYYVDPGSGLLVLQSAASVMVAFGYFMRRRIKALFGGQEGSVDAEVQNVPKKGAHKEA